MLTTPSFPDDIEDLKVDGPFDPELFDRRAANNALLRIGLEERVG